MPGLEPSVLYKEPKRRCYAMPHPYHPAKRTLEEAGIERPSKVPFAKLLRTGKLRYEGPTGQPK